MPTLPLRDVRPAACRVLALLGALSTLALSAADGPSPDPTLSPAVKRSNLTVYQIKMATRFVVPAGNENIDQVRVWHALPTLRPWSQPQARYGAANLEFMPADAKEEHHGPTDSQHLLWTVNGPQKPGTELNFVSTMTVTSWDRNFDPKAANVSWADYATPSADKTAVVDPAVAKAIHPELASVAARLKARYSPPEAVRAMCEWVFENFKYDASVPYGSTDINSIVRNKCGHCGHWATAVQQLTASAGIPFRTVWGMHLSVADGRTSALQKVRADYTNIHTWAEVYFPGIGWIEVNPTAGAKAYTLPAGDIQNNRWFQNYAVWIRESGIQKLTTWTPVPGGFRSDYGVENIISYSTKG